MSTKIKIPKGWRLVRNGWRIRKGDRFKYWDGKFLSANKWAGSVNKNHDSGYGIAIRRIPKKRKGKS